MTAEESSRGKRFAPGGGAADRSAERRRQRHRKKRYDTQYSDEHRKIGQVEIEQMLVREHGLRATTAKQVMRSVREMMARALLEGHDVGITGVGTIQCYIQKGRVYKSPRDGSLIQSGDGYSLAIQTDREIANALEEKGKTGKLRIKASRLLAKQMNKEDPLGIHDDPEDEEEIPEPPKKASRRTRKK